MDYTSLNYDLSTLPAQFNSYYTFSTAYRMQGNLGNSLAQLYPVLITDRENRPFTGATIFRDITIPFPLPIRWSPITNTNWPVYWSGIGNMDEQDFINGVNSY